MQLVADRFAVDDEGRAFDLATGARVTLSVGIAGGVSEQLRWTEECTRRLRVHDRAAPSLIDFGLVGETQRFEAVAPRGKQLHETGSRYPRAIRLIEQPAVRALAEMFTASAGARPHIASLWGPGGSGKGVIAAELARIARTNGFVPVAARLIGSRRSDLWKGRSLFVIADAAEDDVWEACLSAVMRDPVPHVLLLVGEHECRSVSGVGVKRMPVDALLAAVEPSQVSGPLAARVRRAAERSQGWPGRFARLLWGDAAAKQPPLRAGRRSRLSRVAEQAAVYGGADTPSDPFETAAAPCAWPAPGELATLRRKMTQAVEMVGQGRHAPGIRRLRQIIGSLARRGAWSDAAQGGLTLARALLRRGQTRDTLAVAEDAREYAVRAGEQTTLLDLAVVSGEAWIDLGRLDEADTVLGTGLAAARGLDDPERIASVSLALARTSYWRGDYADAEVVLASAPDAASLRGRRDLLAARVAAGHGDLARAMALISAVPEPTAASAYVSGLIHAAAGDLAAAERDLAESLALARASRDPQRALRARLLIAELERARGRAAVALAQLQRVRRLVAASPPLVRRRWELVRALAAPEVNVQTVIAKQIKGTGLGALGLYAAAGSRADGRPGPCGPGSGLVETDAAEGAFAGELVAILRVCQTATDEVEPLQAVCARLRQHLHAASVAFVVVGGGRAHAIAADGPRLEGGIAARAIDAGITIAPHRIDDRIEAAAPVDYGGETIGALCARWTIGSTYDISRAAPVLTMSAAATAPMLAAVVARTKQGHVGPSELLGITPVIVELRQSVERAAAAPFAVLIDGESGSGKELVARAIHRGSARRQKAFSTLNCAALPDDLVEAELFGHSRGAFTGAVADRAGVFEEAHGGTLFLDEIGELTPRAQAKVLRVIQDGELRRVGENLSRRVDVRIVSATNRALRQEVEAGRFRLDLLYRLDVVHITVPPLRERREDIAVLAEHVWRDATARVGSRATLGAATLAALARYDWPGNVRELQNVLASLAVRAAKRGVVPASALPPPFTAAGGGEVWTLDAARRTFEHRFVRAALVRTGGHRGRAAAELGVTRQGLTKLMTRLGIPN